MKHARVYFVMLLGLLLTFVVCGSALAQSFPDVPTSHPYYAAIENMAAKGIIGGYTDGNFGPSDLVKRQQFAKMIVLIKGLTPTESDMCSFPDVEHTPGNLYPYHYVALAGTTGLTTGYANGTFGPANPITRQQVITMAVRAGGANLATPPAGWAGSFSYADSAHGQNIRKAEYNGLLSGIQFTDTTQNATRGECAQILNNVLPFAQGGNPQPPTGDTATVTRIVDGDTIHVSLGGADTTVRLIGMDAPETGEPLAANATSALTALANGKTVRLEYDVDKTDQYGRTLAYVWVGSTMANAEMLRLGVATLYTVPPNVKYVDALTAAEDEAKAAKRGVWAGSTTCPLQIASVFADAPGNDNDNPNGEYVVFKVLVSGTLVGYSAEDATGHHYDFPDRVFQAGQSFKLHSGSGTDTQTDLYWGSSSAIWNNDHDTVNVLDAQGHILTSYSY